MTDKELLDEISRLKAKNNRLAQEKANLEMISHLMTTLSALDDMKEISQAIVTLMCNVLGSKQVVLYYQSYEQWHSMDLNGRETTCDFPEDPLVAKVIQTGQTHQSGEAVDAASLGSLKPEYASTAFELSQYDSTMSLAIPLSLHDTVYGVVKLEDMLLSFSNLTPPLETISSYLALVLKNQLSSLKRLERLNRELQQQNQTLAQLAAVLDNIQDFIGVINLDGQPLYHNPFGLAMLGYPQDMVSQLGPEALHPAEDIEHLKTVIFPQVIREGSWHGESRILHRDGYIIPVDQVIFPVYDKGGKLFGLGTIMRDITKQKEMETSLRQRDKMEAIGQLAGGVAHDFNNQLGGIIGYADLLVARMTDRELVLYAENIIKASNRAADLTKKLLAFARKGKYITMPVNIHEIVHEVVNLLQHSIDKRITIEQELNAASPMTSGDPTQLQNALLNLGVNARDAMPDGGSLLFKTSQVSLEAGALGFELEKGQYIEIIVEDTGTGMPVNLRKHIFEPFFTTKDPGRGTGLGLAAVYGTAKNHHGAIAVDSEVGRGTSFKLYLPLLDVIPTTSPLKPSSSPTKGNAHILLVDDEEMIRHVGAEMLRELGYTVETCSDGQEAVSRYHQTWETIDLVIIDMVMPSLNGRETFIAMRAINPTVRAVISSGYSVEGEAQTMLQKGILGFIPKPFRISELAQQVAAALHMNMAKPSN